MRIGSCFLLALTFVCLATAQTPVVPAKNAGARPRLTTAQWREDLQFAVDTFLAHDRSFNPEARKQFRAVITELQKTADEKSDEQIIVALAKAVALSGNAHTRLYLLRNRSELRRYPIRVWWFADGLYVVRTTPEYSELLGARILRLGGRSVAQLKRAVDPLFAGNASWLKYMSAYTMTSPDVLIGLGLVPGDGKTEVEFMSRGGKRERRQLEPLPLRRSDQPTESWWDLAPTRNRDDGAWVSALSLEAARLPLYLRNTQRQYWSQFLPAGRLFYIQFNRSGDAVHEPFAEFGKRVLNELHAIAVNKIVVDMRFNTGGNLDIARTFMDQLAALARERKLKVYVITGRATFSAGLFHAMQLRQFARAVLVGEQLGDRLDFWSEGGNDIAPNSKLSLHYADRFHSYSPIKHPELEQYLINNTDLSISNPGPDILVNLTSSDYFAGRDPALQTIWSAAARRRFGLSFPNRSHAHKSIYSGVGVAVPLKLTRRRNESPSGGSADWQ